MSSLVSPSVTIHILQASLVKPHLCLEGCIVTNQLVPNWHCIYMYQATIIYIVISAGQSNLIFHFPPVYVCPTLCNFSISVLSHCMQFSVYAYILSVKMTHWLLSKLLTWGRGLGSGLGVRAWGQGLGIRAWGSGHHCTTAVCCSMLGSHAVA